MNYESGRFEESMESAREVLSLEPENSEAQELLNQSRISLDSAIIDALIIDYQNALEQARLASFYQANCTPSFSMRSKGMLNSLLLCTQILKPRSPGTNIRFLERNAGRSVIRPPDPGNLQTRGHGTTAFPRKHILGITKGSRRMEDRFFAI